MGHPSEDLSRAEHHNRMAQPAASTDSVNPIVIGSGTVNTGTVSGNVSISISIDTISWVQTFVMKNAHIYQQNQLAGMLEARDNGSYRFTYEAKFRGEPVSLTMPTSQAVWEFPRFPAPFEGLLPEGVQLDALLRIRKLDRTDLFGQLLAVGHDVVGSLRIEAVK